MSSNLDISTSSYYHDSWLYNLEIKKYLIRKTGHEDKIYPRFSEKKFEEFRKQHDVNFKRKIQMN